MNNFYCGIEVNSDFCIKYFIELDLHNYIIFSKFSNEERILKLSKEQFYGVNLVGTYIYFIPADPNLSSVTTDHLLQVEFGMILHTH